MSPFKRYRDAAIIVLLLVVPFRFVGASMKHPNSLNIVDRAMLRVSAPIEFAASSLARGISNLWGDYVYLVDVKTDNARLAYDNARLRETAHRLEENEVENRELKRLLQLRETLPGDTVSAQVVGKDFTEFFRVTRVILDRGSRDVRANMPVVSPDGVVGKVLHIAGDSVDVQLAVDAAFGIDVEDERTRAHGFVRGTGDPARYSCKVEMVNSEDEVEPGDLLVTTGKGKWFPKGLSVARVTKVQKRELGRDQDVEATPTVNFSRLDDVLILITPPSDDEEGPHGSIGGSSPTTASRGAGPRKP
jgi:rod shape-determining protein MreC